MTAPELAKYPLCRKAGLLRTARNLRTANNSGKLFVSSAALYDHLGGALYDKSISELKHIGHGWSPASVERLLSGDCVERERR